MKHNPANAEWFDRDRFVLSAGHASMLLYSSLYLSGYGLTLDDLKNFRQLGSPTAGHPERGDAAGIEATTGPLGQGISMAVGLALAEAMLAARYNRPGHDLIDHRTFVIASDGDIQEGVASEACSLAGHLGPRQADGLLRQQPHPARRRDRDGVLRGRAASASRPTAGTCRTWARTSSSSDIEQAIDAAGAVRRPALADRAAHAHRLRLAQQAGLLQGARLAARRGRGAPDQGGLRLGPGRPLPRARRGARRTTARRPASAAPPAEAEWQRARRRLPRGAPRRLGGAVARDGGRACPTAGTPSRPSSGPRTGRSPRARPPRR